MTLCLPPLIIATMAFSPKPCSHISSFRRDLYRGAAGKKHVRCLLVGHQFEQWCHEHDAYPPLSLVRAVAVFSDQAILPTHFANYPRSCKALSAPL